MAYVATYYAAYGTPVGSANVKEVNAEKCISIKMYFKVSRFSVQNYFCHKPPTFLSISQAIIAQSHIFILNIAFSRYSSFLQMFQNLCKGKRHVILGSLENEVFGVEINQSVEKHIGGVSPELFALP